MIQVNSDSNKIKENKYKILRMSLLLGNGEDRDETLNNFEEAAREIDAMNDEVYLKDLDKKFYDTFKLEEEEKKLASLVDYIGGRVEQRMSLIEDFANVTGYELSNLPIIKYQDRLDEYKSRLRYIREYLQNTNRINKLNQEIDNYEKKLNDANVKKSKSEERNVKAENELFSRFKNVINNIDLFKGITQDNIDSKLNEIISVTSESKKSLDIFNKSFATLSQAGISGDEKNEYLSYVNSAKDVYYENKEQEYLLRLYSLLCTNESEYDSIVVKRNTINDLVTERINLRRELGVKDNDILSSIYDLLDRQYAEIKEEKINIDNIDSYTQEIESRKIEVSGLEQDNQKVEILSLLKEFCIIDTYEEENTEISSDEVETSEVTEEVKEEDNSDDIFANIEPPKVEESVKEEVPVVEEKEVEVEVEEPTKEEVSINIEDAKDNQVVSVVDALDMNLAVATEKSNSVMKRVGEMLGVKVEIKEEKIEEPVKEEESSDVPEDIFDNRNYDADPEDNVVGNTEVSPASENPLFNSEFGNSTLDEVMANNNIDESKIDNDFWFSNDESTLDLNSLPDINSQNDNFFATGTENAGNNTPSLDFPEIDGFDSEEDK